MSNFYKEHKKGIIGTIIFHVFIIVIFMIFGYSTPLPLPGEEGILINFGDNDNGLGQIEPQLSEPAQQEASTEKQESTPESTSKKNEGAVTQDYEEAPAVKEQAKEIKKEDKKPDIKTEPVKVEKKEVVKEQEVNKQALFTKQDHNNNNSTNEGETEEKGNQGSKTGSTESNNHKGGDSIGTNGTSFSLNGRNPESLPKPDYNYQIEGKVVVEITVDKYGTVTSAAPGAHGSTTLDANLLEAAKKAALKARFNKKPDAPAYQKGTITYIFKLQ